MRKIRGGAAIIIPVKPLPLAKSRLASELQPQKRIELARSMAEHVIKAAADTGAAVYVVTADDEIGRVASKYSARLVADPEEAIRRGPGSPEALNLALRAGIEAAGEEGAAAALIAPADLPYLTASDLEIAALRPGPEGIAIAPSSDGKGTNALSVPLPVPIALSFGTNSFEAHISQAFKMGIPVRVLRRRGLCHDVDTPSSIYATDWTNLNEEKTARNRNSRNHIPAR